VHSIFVLWRPCGDHLGRCTLIPALITRYKSIGQKNASSKVVEMNETYILCAMPSSLCLQSQRQLNNTYYEYLSETVCSTIKYVSLCTYCSGGWVSSIAGLDVMFLPRIEPRFLGCPAHNSLLHRRLYRGSYKSGSFYSFKVRYKTNLKQSSTLI
jgi:hypothetical protein